MTVKALRDWLADKPDDAKVRVMIESKVCQYDFPATDVAISKKMDGSIPSIIIMHENEKNE
jgi:hypothetical protein